MSFNYSLAPENPFPTGLCDCFAAITAVRAPVACHFTVPSVNDPLHVQVLQHLRPRHLVLAGDSAGANLALATATMILHPQYMSPDSRNFCAHTTQTLQHREELHLADAAACSALLSAAMQKASPVAAQTMGGDISAVTSTPSPRVSAVLLLYPALDPSRASTSHVTHAASPALSASEMTWFWQQYVPDYNVAAAHTASPLYAALVTSDDILQRLPPVFVATAGQDPLCDEGTSLATRLKVRCV